MEEPDLPSAEADRKRALRARARAHRREADPSVRDGLASAWADGVLALDAVRSAQVVAVYVAYGVEPPTAALISALVAREVRVLVPILLEDRDLDWAAHDAPSVGLGLDALATADVVVVPALLVGQGGERLGQGGGSYDRALGRMRPGSPIVALVHDDEVLPVGGIPRETHDRAVTHVVTPTRALAVGAGHILPIDPDLDDEVGVAPSADLDVALAVAAGGAIGAAARWGLNQAIPHTSTEFPWSTFLENVSGAFLLGVLIVLILEVWPPHRYLRPFLAVGVLGGFTTFSTYVADVRGLADGGHAATALGYLLLTLLLGIGASWAGLLTGRRVAGDRSR